MSEELNGNENVVNEYLAELSARCSADLEPRNIVNVTTITENHNKDLYISRFHRIPNWLGLSNINCEKAITWFSQNYRNEISDCFYEKYYKKRRKVMTVIRIHYFLYNDLMVFIDDSEDEINFYYRKTSFDLVEKIANQLKKFRTRRSRRTPEIELLITTSHGGLSTQSMKINRPKFSIEDNYNDDFLPVHQTILTRLRKKNDKGLVLLHGKPGTGKTTYIRYLITNTKKKVIFLPPNIAGSITSPGLMNVLVENPDSVFVIEDAENIVLDRNTDGISPVSALLNLADGLLSDCLNIQIICSFNTDLSRVDSALTRKGRLIAKYEFLELETEKAQTLSNKLGFNSVVTSPMTLAAVYNQNETEFVAQPQKKVMGFGKVA